MKRLKTEHYKIESADLPKSFDGVRIVFLSDLHGKSYGENNEELVAAINKLNPDYVFIGGDMMVGRISTNLDTPYLLVSELVKKYPVYYGVGNHEKRLMTYEETKDTTYLRYKTGLMEKGVVFLENSGVSLERGEEAVCLYGLSTEYKYYGKGPKRASLPLEEMEKYIPKPDASRFNILLAHNPEHYPVYDKWGADLVLSGHIHGGVMILPRIGGVISPTFELFPKYDFGLFSGENGKMVLSRGLGTHTINIRIFNPPEISLVELIKTEQ
ncbi:MAG: metallophosphoesterase [Lachnospiraceae bacterium]|nr:metallophosphoesterase [Lachnospiraceae bacterium]